MRIHTFLLLLISVQMANAQKVFTRKDSLRGGFHSERTDYDVRHYDLRIRVDPEKQFIRGYNDITFTVKENTTRIQMDLYRNMKADSIVFEGKQLTFWREYNAVIIDFKNAPAANKEHKLQFYYSGQPTVARNAPWDGGFVFSADSNGKPWVGVAVQGAGASLWYPCKDSQSDEPEDGAMIRVAVPDGLMNVSNGKLKGSRPLGDGYTQWDWEVRNPINNYNITLNIGDYVHFGELYKGLTLDYYVLRDNLEKAKSQFSQVKPMLDCFQEKFGAYPFPEDGYKLVETPYLGMEHQSAVAYGNKYTNGYLGTDLSSTGIGMQFDFIIIHESGHEWFGNSITSRDIADMWIHEAFTCYSESVYVECQHDRETAFRYINGLRENILNDKPVIGEYGVADKGSADMYYKGALMLHTIRSIINDDEKWWALIYDYATTYRHRIIDTKTVMQFFNERSGIDLSPVFDQYLLNEKIPVLQLKLDNNKLAYRWSGVSTLDMPVDIRVKGVEMRIYPTMTWQTGKIKVRKAADVEVRTDKFLVDVKYF